MTQIPYSPMRGPEKAVSEEQMWQKLAKHAPAQVEIHLHNAAQTPKEEPAVALQTLVWEKPVRTGENSGYVLTQCGRYSISKDPVRGKPLYSAWRLQFNAAGERELPIHLGIRVTRQDAERLCQIEAERA